MTYSVKEIFYTLQGEGANAGRPAVFCRFAGCNLWSGREPDRANAVCRFCDTDFVGTDGDFGKKYATAPELAQQITALWPVEDLESRFVVLTGGEPLLQVDDALVDALHACGFWIAVETNGTVVPPNGLDWITVSPKAGAPLNVKRGDEIKLVWPQEGLDPIKLEALEFRYRYLQPLDDPSLRKNTQACVELCLRRPQWRLSLQTHKLVGVR